MSKYTAAGSVMIGRCWPLRYAIVVLLVVQAIVLIGQNALAETVWTPSIGVTGLKDDNIRFTGDDSNNNNSNNNAPEDDFIYLINPGLKLDYDQEITKFESDANVTIRRYDENDQYDDEIYRFNFKGNTSPSERFLLHARYEFIKDTTLDAELEETGVVFDRDERLSHNLSLGPSFNINERLSTGLSGNFRRVTYDADRFFDYSAWSVGLPVRWLLDTDLDTISITPGYGYRDSDANRSESYTLRFGWDHETTERLEFRFSIGARYTELEDLRENNRENNNDNTSESWGGLGSLELNYDFLTGDIKLDLEHNLQNTANGDQVNVSRVWMRIKKNFSQRFSTQLNGRYYYTENEGGNDDNSRRLFKGDVRLAYNLTENHLVFIAYEYSQKKFDDNQNNNNNETDSSVERNVFWAGIRLNFPMQ